jgi:lipopolysaccharide transport system permease protein
MLPLFIVLATLLALGVGMFMSALNVKYRDVRYALPFLIQIWLFASPVIYPSSLMPERWKWVLLLNPMTGIIEGFRASLLSRNFDWAAVTVASVLTVTIVIVSAYIFRRVEETFADIV